MKNILLVVLIAFAASITLSSASSIQIIEPFNQTLYNNGTIFLGNVGPGQPFYITALSATQNASGVTIIRGWNQMYALNLPQGWIASNSSVYSKTLSVEVTPSPNASTGTYNFTVLAKNFGNYSKLGNIEFTVRINVTPNVFGLSIYPKNVSSGPSEPVYINVTISNTGVSDSPFYISTKGLPVFNKTEEVIALHGTTERFSYPVYESEPGVYPANITVGSVASSIVHKEANITLTVSSSIPNDYNALGYGTVAFPVIYEPVYSVMYFINLISKYV